MGKSKNRTELTKENILHAAMNLADSIGIDAFTIRQLAGTIGVGTMSIYHYFKSKEKIIDGMVEAVYAEIELPPEDKEWKEAIKIRSCSAREILNRHPWAPALINSRKLPGKMNLRHQDAVIACLRRGGLSLSLISKAVAVIDSYIYGFAMQEASLPGGGGEEMIEMGRQMAAGPFSAYPNLLELTVFITNPGYNFAEIFNYGLELILNGLGKEAALSTN